jgi:hypothetical protein
MRWSCRFRPCAHASVPSLWERFPDLMKRGLASDFFAADGRVSSRISAFL